MYTIINVIKDALTGKLEFAEPNIVRDRRGECLLCELRNQKLNTCTICGCYLPWKTKLKKASCPMELW